MRPLKVWGYRGCRQGCPPSANGSKMTREIVAAPSKAAAIRALGTSAYDFRQFGCVTGNVREVEVALSKPGTVFWRPLDDYRALWTEAKPRVKS